MKKIYIIGIASFLLCLNILLLIQFAHYKNKQIIYMDILQHEIKESMPFKDNFVINIENNGCKIENIQCKDRDNEYIPIKSLFHNGKERFFVCRFSEMDCESCIDFAIQQTRKSSISIGKDNVLYIGSYRNNKIFNKLKDLYEIEYFKVLNVNGLNVPIESIGKPYYFVLDSSLHILDPFVPNKNSQETSQKYLDAISKKYFQ